MWRQSALVHTRTQTIGEVLPHNALCFIQSQDGEREFVNLVVGCNTVHKSNCRHRAKPLEGSHMRENKQFFFIVLYRGLKSTRYCFNGLCKQVTAICTHTHGVADIYDLVLFTNFGGEMNVV